MKVITVGRSSDNDVVINDAKVSRKHLQFVYNDSGVWSVVDLNSASGTFVNGQKITGEIRLQLHDVIRIGDTTLPWTMSYMMYIENQPMLMPSSQSEIINVRPLRYAAVVTLWLKFIVVANIAAIILMITCVWNSLIWFYATEENARLFFFVQHNIIDYYEYGMYANIAAMIINIVSAVLLLKLRKCGFWIYLISHTIMLLVMILYANLGGITSIVIISMIEAIASPMILYAILHIKKYGASSWALLK